MAIGCLAMFSPFLFFFHLPVMRLAEFTRKYLVSELLLGCALIHSCDSDDAIGISERKTCPGTFYVLGQTRKYNGGYLHERN